MHIFPFLYLGSVYENRISSIRFAGLSVDDTIDTISIYKYNWYKDGHSLYCQDTPDTNPDDYGE
jgi:hypothetical protein